MMKRIAIPTNNNFVESHFGKCDHYTIVTLDTAGNVIETELLRSEGTCGCKSDIAHTLSKRGVSLLLAGNMGEGAVHKFAGAGIEIIRGCHGPVEQLLHSYTSGALLDSGVSCGKHSHHHG